MRNTSAKICSINVKDILDSDDELPTEYIDLPFVPAYQVDNRFEYIEEKKVDKELNKQRKEQSECHLRSGLNNGTTMVACGYLNKKDTFCLQSLEPNTGKKTQQWFLNFLVKKDLHASYTFLTSCLVPSYDNSSGNTKSSKGCNEKIWTFEKVASK